MITISHFNSKQAVGFSVSVRPSMSMMWCSSCSGRGPGTRGRAASGSRGGTTRASSAAARSPPPRRQCAAKEGIRKDKQDRGARRRAYQDQYTSNFMMNYRDLKKLGTLVPNGCEAIMAAAMVSHVS